MIPLRTYLPLFFASRSTIRLKSHLGPHSEVRSVTHEEVHYTPEELHDWSDLYQQKSGTCMWKWILRVWDNRKNKLDQVKFISMCRLSKFKHGPKRGLY